MTGYLFLGNQVVIESDLSVLVSSSSEKLRLGPLIMLIFIYKVMPLTDGKIDKNL